MDHVDVDRLNISMQTQGAERLRLAMNPDQAIGVIFYFEGVLANTRAVQEAARISRSQDPGSALTSTKQIYNLHPLHAAALVRADLTGLQYELYVGNLC